MINFTVEDMVQVRQALEDRLESLEDADKDGAEVEYDLAQTQAALEKLPVE